ncbi:MAG: AI-2E family transporter [Chloroflexota bacterium]
MDVTRIELDTAEHHDRLAPDWLRWLGAIGWRILVTLALGAFLVLIAAALSTTTVAVIVSILIAAACSPYIQRLRARGWSRSKAAAAGTLAAAGVILGAVVLIALAVVPYIVEVLQAVQGAIANLQRVLTETGLPPEIAAIVGDIVTGLQTWLSAQTSGLTDAAATLGTIGVLSLFTVFFLLQDGDKAWAWLIRPAREWRRARLEQAGHDTLLQVGGYLRGSSVNAAVDAVTDFAFLLVLGVPLAGPLAVLVFFAGFVPYVGNFLATLTLILLAFASGGPVVVLALIALIAATNVIKHRRLSPLIFGKTVNLHPAVILVALPTGLALAGVVGLFLAVPVAAFLPAVWGAAASVLNEDPDEQTARVPGALEVPAWLDRLAQWSWRVLIVLGLTWLAIGAAAAVPLVVGPMTVAIILAATLIPAVDSLMRRGWTRGQASIVVAVVAWAVVVVFTVLSVIVLANQGAAMVATSEQGSSALAGVDWPSAIAAGFGGGILQTIREVLTGLAALFVGLVLSAVLSFFVLRDGSRGWAALTRGLPGWRHDIVDRAGSRAVEILGGYMISTGVLSAFGAGTQFVIMVVLGLPLAAPVAVLSFFLGFIPYIGSFLATGVALLITIAVGDTSDIVIMVIWTVVFNIVQGSIIAPLVYGKAVSLHPAIVLLAIPAGGQLAGVVGMFLAVPVLGVISASWRSILQVLGDRPPSPEVAPDADASAITLSGATVPGPEAEAIVPSS